MNDFKQLFFLDGRIAFLTGSYRGLGFKYAQALASAGARVILNGRNVEGVELAVEKLRKEGSDAYGYAFDITNVEATRKAIREMQREHGFIDILVNNAGIQRRGPLENLSLEDWQAVIDLNLTSMFTVSQLLVQDMIKRHKGKIINIASLMSYITRPTTGPYTASKGGVVALTRSMAVEWGKYNIQANAIAPGYFHTEMTEKLVKDPDFNRWIIGRTPAARWGIAEDLTGILIFLASNASNFINGECILIDGGLSAAI